MTQVYHPQSNDDFFYYRFGSPQINADPAHVQELNRAWLFAIKEKPIEYLKHRLSVFASLTRIGYRQITFTFHPGFSPEKNEFNFTYHPKKLVRFWSVKQYEWPWIFFPWIYLVLSLTVFFCADKKLKRILFFVFLSSMAFTLPHVLIVPGYDFRYLHWPILCSVILFASVGLSWILPVCLKLKKLTGMS